MQTDDTDDTAEEARQRAATLQQLMKRHGAAVYRYCCEQLHDPILAEDVHQQIFIQVYRDLPRFAGRSSVRTWLFAIAHHRVLDAAKSRQRTTSYFEHDEDADVADPTATPDVRLEEARLRAALAACVHELDPETRSALLLRYQQGFSFEQMAEICGQRAGTLQARVQRALPLLRKRIQRRAGGRP